MFLNFETSKFEPFWKLLLLLRHMRNNLEKLKVRLIDNPASLQDSMTHFQRPRLLFLSQYARLLLTSMPIKVKNEEK